MLFGKKPIVLDMYTSVKAAYEYSKPLTAVSYIPKWWKSLPSTISTDTSIVGTMKQCSGLTSMYRHGFMIPAWTDLQFVFKRDGAEIHGVSHSKPEVELVSKAIRGTFKGNYHNVKLTPPWLVVCKEDVEFMLVPPYYNETPLSEIDTPIGIVDFKYQHATAVQYMVKHDHVGSHFVNHNTPLAHFVQLSDRPLKINYHLVSESEYASIKSPRIKFRGDFKYRKKLGQAKEASKCPFSSLFK